MKSLLLTGIVAMALVGCGSDKPATDKKATDAPKTSTATATASAPANK